MTFNIEDFKNIKDIKNRYDKHIDTLKGRGYSTQHIECTVSGALENIQKNILSFVIYGEPQSGKTELMITLTAKLLDEGHKVIIILLNDNVGLLEQNLGRFAESNITPDPKNYKEILNSNIKISGTEWIIFCKKNSGDLQKLIERVKCTDGKIIIDDESDYASPDGKVNKEEKTKINELVESLIGSSGIYIGVTATPARLDLNNTFDNQNTKWVEFKSHEKYTGQDTFFPVDINSVSYKRNFLPDGDAPAYLRDSFFRFLVHSTYLNLENSAIKNYSMLIHTSGKKSDHDKDYNNIIEMIEVLKDENHTKYKQYVKSIYDIASKVGNSKAHDITRSILEKKSNIKVLVINSNKDKDNLEKATKPSALFTIAIGGNIISRGVTFNNLLSMYFTRSVKGKMQQDTYIQRARMFGTRGDYLESFDLTIPKELYGDWHTCFIYHKLALESVKTGNIPVWIDGKKTRAVAPSSIDKNTVEMSSGEMSFAIFYFKNHQSDIEKIITDTTTHFEKFTQLKDLLQASNAIPEHLYSFINDKHDSLAVHDCTDISNRGEDTDKENISRERGLIGKSELETQKYPNKIHHIKIFFNQINGKARVFYKYTYPLRFLQNTNNV